MKTDNRNGSSININFTSTNAIFVVLLVGFLVGLVRFDFLKHLGIEGDKGSIVTLISFVSIYVCMIIIQMNKSIYDVELLKNQLNTIDAKLDKVLTSSQR